MIKKIATIKNLAVFKDFDWDSIVRDRDNRPVYFKPLNIIYGRNYSGKTTISRILRALETGELSDKYTNPAFKVEFIDGTTVNQTSPKAHPYTVRVFNEDFVRSHLRSFFDDEHAIAPFAVLGDDNPKYAVQLDKKEAELGSEEMPGSLLAKEAECSMTCLLLNALTNMQLRHSIISYERKLTNPAAVSSTTNSMATQTMTLIGSRKTLRQSGAKNTPR